MAAMFALVAALPTPYVPHMLHIDPLQLGGSQGRARLLLAFVR
jgi:hypothetical protein